MDVNTEKKIQGNDDISMKDYVRVVIRRKNVILDVFIVTIVVVLVFTLLTPKIYKISTILEISKVENAKQVVEKIKNGVYDMPLRKKFNISEKDLPQLKVSVKDSDLLAIEAETSKVDQTKDILDEMSSMIITEQSQKINANKEITEQSVKRISEKINHAEEERKNLEAKVDALQKVLVYNQDPGTQFALFDAKEKIEDKRTEIEDLHMEIDALKRSEIEIDIVKIIKPLVVSDNPVKSDLFLNIIIAAVVGLFLGIFMAFYKEWWDKNKKDIY